MANSFPGSGLAYADQFAVGRSSGTGLLNTFLSNDPNTNQIRVETDNSAVLTYIGISAGVMEYYRGANTSGTLRFQTKVQAASSANAGGAIVFSPNGTASDYTPVERMRILMNGNVGIGTDVPSTILNIASSAPTIRLNPTTQNNPTAIEFGVLNAGTCAYAKIDAVNAQNYDTNLRFFTNNAGDATQVERMRITYTGVVGIGTSSPSNHQGVPGLTVSGTSGNRGIIEVWDGTSGKSVFQQVGGSTYIGQLCKGSGAGDVYILTGGNGTSANVSMFLSCAGNVGIGATSPAAKLHLCGSGDNIFRGESTNTGTVANLFITKAGATVVGYYAGINVTGGAPGGWEVYDAICNISRLYIKSEGSMGIGTCTPTYKLHVNGTFYAAGSSQDYKQSICNYNTDSCMFMKLKPVTYQYKDEYCHLGKELKSGTQIGLIAEEVAETYPELAILVNEEANKVVRNVDYEKLSVILLSEVQKLRREVDDLKHKQ